MWNKTKKVQIEWFASTAAWRGREGWDEKEMGGVEECRGSPAVRRGVSRYPLVGRGE